MFTVGYRNLNVNMATKNLNALGNWPYTECHQVQLGMCVLHRYSQLRDGEGLKSNLQLASQLRNIFIFCRKVTYVLIYLQKRALLICFQKMRIKVSKWFLTSVNWMDNLKKQICYLFILAFPREQKVLYMCTLLIKIYN